MKKLFISFAIAVMAFVSCSKEALNESATIETKSYSLTAVAPGDDVTKTSLQKNEESGKWNVLWSEGDALKVKISGDGTDSSHYTDYTLESGAGTGNAVFRGTVEAPDQVFAFYPSSLTASINGYGMFFDIPTEQTYSAAEVVSNNSLPMWANGDKTNLAFNHVCSIIRIPVWTDQAGAQLSKVTVSSDKNLFGRWYFNKSGLNNPLPASSASTTMSLVCDNLVLSTSESEPTILNFITGVVGGSCGNLEIRFIFNDGSTFTKLTSSLSTNAIKGKIYKLPVLKISKVVPDMQIKIDGGSWENWDGVSDIDAPETSVAVKGTNSKLSYDNLALILAKIKSGSKKIDLDFGSITAASDLLIISRDRMLFESNFCLNNVILPQGILKVQSMAFLSTSVGCVTLPSSVASVGPYIFYASKNSSFAVDPSNPKYCAIDGQLYEKNGTSPETYTLAQVACSKVGSFTLTENTTAIGDHGLAYCDEITELIIPETVTSIGVNSTRGAKNLAKITLLGEEPPVVEFNSNPVYHWVDESICAGYGVASGKTITVPAGCLEAYTGTEGNRTDWWKQYHDIAGFEFTE